MLSSVTRQVVFINAAHLLTHYSLLILATKLRTLVLHHTNMNNEGTHLP